MADLYDQASGWTDQRSDRGYGGDVVGVVDPARYSPAAVVVIEADPSATPEQCRQMKERAEAAFGMKVTVLAGARLARITDETSPNVSS